MQDQRIEKLVAFAVNITKLLVIIYLGLVEVFRIAKLTRKILVTKSNNSQKWASKTYSILKILIFFLASWESSKRFIFSYFLQLKINLYRLQKLIILREMY